MKVSLKLTLYWRWDELRIAGRRSIVETERLDAEQHAIDGGHCGRTRSGEPQRSDGQRLQKIAATRNHERAPISAD